VAALSARACRRHPSAFRIDGSKIESPLYLVELDNDGAIVRLLDRRADREVVPAGLAANRLELFQDGPERESAWNIHQSFERRAYDWDRDATAVSVVEQGSVRLVLRKTRTFRESRIEQDTVIWAGFPRIDFVTRADWRERQVLLKAAFPCAVRSERAAFEVQFGAVYRSTHANTSWDQERFEVCAHRFMDVSEPGYGVSVLNDSRYGCDVRGSVMRLTLLRGAEWPDPEADRGVHELTYSLYPHAGDWTDAGTARRAWELNAPVVCRAADGVGASKRFLTVTGPAFLETLKRAEDGNGWILRLYEPHGARGPVSVTAPRPLASVNGCNHVEETAEPIPSNGSSFSFPIEPFQVRSFRIAF
jgi:alpha-mannosidase